MNMETLSKMKRATLWLCAWAAAFAVIALVMSLLPSTAHAATTHGVSTLSLLGGVVGMISYDWRNAPGGPVLSRAQLEQMARPSSGGNNEVIPHVLYDTQSITTAVTTQATYFQALQTDKTLGNVPGPGQLPDPYFFIVQYVAADFLIIPATGTKSAFTPWSDLAEILVTQRATFTATINDKIYGPYPLVTCHALGGVNAFGVIEGATADPGAGVFNVNNGAPGSGGFYVGGAWTIEPKVGYSVQVNLAAAPTLTAGPVRLRMSLVGTLYRAVR